MRVTVRDIEEVNQMDTGWDLDFMQVSGGPLHGEISMLKTDRAQLGSIWFNRTVRQRGVCPPGTVTFALVTDPSIHIKWCGREVDGSQLLVFPVGDEFESVSYGDFAVYTFSVERSRLLLEMEKHGLDATSLVSTGRKAIKMEGNALHWVREGLLQLTSRLDPNGKVPHLFAARLERELVAIAIQGLASTVSHTPSSQRFRDDVLCRAEIYLARNLGEEITLAKLSAAAGASPRTLQYVFKEYYGLTPMQYLKSLRLWQVRRILRKAGPNDVNIYGVASGYGFWHMSQFARDYHRQFDELPSQTLAATNARYEQP